jgi:hypothetical protein
MRTILRGWYKRGHYPLVYEAPNSDKQAFSVVKPSSFFSKKSIYVATPEVGARQTQILIWHKPNLDL